MALAFVAQVWGTTDQAFAEQRRAVSPSGLGTLLPVKKLANVVVLIESFLLKRVRTILTTPLPPNVVPDNSLPVHCLRAIFTEVRSETSMP